ncbi:SDR family oxidoreductase [Tetragenococcus koreensis]|uniref:2-deoxy-D-gluconate 3-dehydrogenase n=1 Tax=Tetragenococcus koreensis TaxID=290335 RepID=A0AAN4UC53_9ENTE|nr:SDR family oxidoreductase [Tetragenococcus koreensis]MDN5907049.1 SDR family oxidoreductase [Staphylococcus equorum]MDN6279081.1 SDR family oxidoreductase [Lactococcus lactis]AYW46341.1 2-deoxy-D-gluconate 3-dehydrogenase [Tetragenococcus koreensis]MCF1585407.1 SDR family oxidoreductase [Tetragenococcus koreensis]MCF1614953.1 SDR family oxidoreductase [Tetragenococcus koreensis]
MSDTWLELKNKVVVVTGAVGGMGRVICQEFAKQQAKVVMLDLDVEAVEAYAKEVADEYKVETLALGIDTTDESAVDKAVTQVIEKFGRVDTLVNTAAMLRGCPLEDLPLEEWRQTVDINLTGYFLVSQRFGRVMIEQKSGNMVHVSTIASIFPETYSAAYSSTKAGVNMLSRQIAAEWGQFGVRSNCVLPCLVKTPLSASFYADPEVESGRKALTANKRIGNTMDIANAVLYLSSDRSDYTNGHELRVEGGFGIMMGDQIPKPGGRREFAEKQHNDYLAKINENKL